MKIQNCKKWIAYLIVISMLSLSCYAASAMEEGNDEITAAELKTEPPVSSETVLPELAASVSAAEHPADPETQNVLEAPKTAVDESGPAIVAEDSGGLPVVTVGDYDISDSVSMYENFDYSDPQYITDKLLFGEWDAANGCWTPQPNSLIVKNNLQEYYGETLDKPLLNYEAFPELAEVEEAVRECRGDYDTPKARLLQYYRKKYTGVIKDVITEDGRYANKKAVTVKANALAYNFSAQLTTPLDLFDVSSEKSWYKFDVKNSVASAQQYTFMVRATQLDQATASFGSEESADKPYIELELSDGNTRKIFPSDDATLRAGAYGDETYGKDAALEVSERKMRETTSDDATRIAILKFDFSFIPEGTRINSASLYLCGQTEKQTAQRLILTGHVFTDWSEKDITWNKYPTGDRTLKADYSFDTFPGEMSFAGRIAGFSTVSPLVAQYAADENEIYAYHAIRNIINLHREYYNKPFDISELHGTGSDVRQYVNDLYVLLYSDYMTPEAFAVSLKTVYFLEQWLLEGWNRYGKIYSNHGTYINIGFGSVAIHFPEFRQASDPMILTNPDDPQDGGRGGWNECLNRRLIFKLNGIWVPDGAGLEAPLGYNMQSYGNTVGILQYALEMNRLELLPDEFYEVMGNFALAFLLTSTPGFGDWQIGNSYGNKSNFIQRPEIKYMLDALEKRVRSTADKTTETYKKEEAIYNQLLWAYYKGAKGGKKPPQTSMLFPIVRNAIFRSSWSDDAVAAHFNINTGGIHSHFQDLSIVLQAHGKYLLVDSPYMDYNYDSPYRAWEMSTRGHNTIEINDVSQRGGLWNNSEVVTDIFGNKIVLPFRNEHGVKAAAEPVTAAFHNGEFPEIQKIIKERDYTNENLRKYYEADDAIVTASVGQDSTIGRQGKFIENNMNDIFDYVKGETYGNIGVTYADDKGYYAPAGTVSHEEDNEHNRSVFFVRPEFFIVTDYVAPVNGNVKMNKYSQAWHFADDAKIEMDSSNIVKTNYNDVNLAVVPIAGNETPIEAKMIPGLYYVSHAIRTTYPAYTKYADKPTTFNTILFPMKDGKDYDFKTKTVPLGGLTEADASAFYFKATDQSNGSALEGVYYNLHDADAQQERAVAQYRTDGRLMYVDKGAEGYQRAALLDGTEIRGEENEYLVKSNRNISELGVQWNGTRLELSTSRLKPDSSEYVDINQLTVRAGEEVRHVSLNGEEIQFNEENGYIFFGDEPILDAPAEPTAAPTAKPTARPSISHGGSGGFGGGTASSQTTQSTPSPTAVPADKKSDAFSSELKGHWGEEEIAWLVDNDIVNGKDEHTLGLSEMVTRAEFAAMLIRFGYSELIKYTNEFSDVSGSEWYADYLATAKAHGILDGDAGRALPNDFLTREEMAKIAASAALQLGAEPKQDRPLDFTDADQISPWMKGHVKSALDLGLMLGMEDGSFAPQAKVLREQAMMVIYRMFHFE